MAKRATGIEKGRKSHSKKTKKRLAKKHADKAARLAKRRRR